MALRGLLDELAKSAAMLDPGDLLGLVTVKEQFEELASGASSEGMAELERRSRGSADTLERLILKEIDDASAALSEVSSCIEFAQRAFTDAERDISGGVDQVDDDLRDAWISGCADALQEIEAEILNPGDDSVAEVRRRVHTLKGECGVLSLTTAQTLLHHSESLIDVRIDAGDGLPADEILAVVDWMKVYSDALATDPSAPAPAHEDLLEKLLADSSDAESASSESSAEHDSQEVEPEIPEPQLQSESVVSADVPERAASQGEQGDLVTFSESIERDEIFLEFIVESREHIATAEESVLALEQSPEDPELVNAIFRSFHTIKGVAGFMQLDPIVRLSHSAECLLDKIRGFEVQLGSACLDLVLRSCDMLAQMLVTLEGGKAPSKQTLEVLIVDLDAAADGNDPESAPRATTTSKIERVADNPAESDQKAAPKASGDAAGPAKAPSKAKSRIEQTVKVNTTRLDNLVTMVGELVIAQQMVLQDDQVQMIDDQRFQRNLGHTGKIIRDLQEVAMSLRMVTVRSTFQRMHRLVRDVSAKMGKDIRFVMEGEDTELDRNVVEEIGDPLVHMIRNSCDHGIETAAERVAAGKPEQGLLTLRAYHRGGSIVIEVEDDGRGLDREKLLKKAIERGIIPADRDHDQIPDGEVFNLIMAAGFSTAAEVTDISGRGVGMDVVRRNIEAMRGKVEILSEKGRGTVMRMALPLTMAIIDGMIVRVGEQRYVIPTLSIERSFRPEASDLHTVNGRGEMASVRGSLLPVYRMNRAFSLDEGVDDVCDGLLIVLESNDSRCCVVVDEILGQQQVVIKSLGRGIGSIRGVSGGAILGDGRIALIVDVAGLVSEATCGAREQACA